MNITSIPKSAFLRQEQSRATALLRSTSGLRLPAYALDGRRINWNDARTAATFDCSQAEYFSDKSAVSSTALKALDRSGAHYLASLTEDRVETASQRIGTGVHAKVLEPVRFDAEYVVWDGRRQGAKWEAFEAKHAGRQILNRKEWGQVHGCYEKVLSAVALVDGAGQEFTVGDLVDHGECEKTFYWLDEETGLTCKARLDLTCGIVTADIKTTDDARAEAFSLQASQLKYHIQAAFYLRARRAMDPSLTAAPFLFIVPETKAPFETLVHRADDDEFVAFGEKRVKELMRHYKACVERDSWPGYSRPTGTLKLPLTRRYAGLDI